MRRYREILKEFTEQVIHDIKRSDVALGLLYLSFTTLIFLLLVLLKPLAPVSNAINQLTVYHIRLPEDAPRILIVNPNEQSDSLFLSEVKQISKTGKKTAILVPLQWIFWKRLEKANSDRIISFIDSVNRSDGKVEIFLISQRRINYRMAIEADTMLKRISDHIFFWSVNVARDKPSPSPIKLDIPGELPLKVPVVEKLRDFFDIKSSGGNKRGRRDVVNAIPINLSPMPFKQIPSPEIPQLDQIVKSSKGDVILIWVPREFDHIMVTSAKRTLFFSQILALSIWNEFVPIKMKPISIMFDIMVFFVIAVLIAGVRKRINNLFFAIVMIAITIVLLYVYISRYFAHGYYTPRIMEIGLAMWLGYFFVFAVESHLFDRAIGIIKKYVKASRTYMYVGSNFSQAFYSSLKQLIPPLVAMEIRTGWPFKTHVKRYGMKDISPEKLNSLLQYSIKKKLGLFYSTKITLYFESNFPFTDYELNFVERIWKKSVFIPPIVESVYSWEKLETYGTNIYNADNYIEALVYESVGFRYLLDEMESGAAIFCCAGVLIYCNTKFYEILGKKEPPSSGTVIFDLFADTFMEPYIKHIKNVLLMRQYPTEDIKTIEDTENKRFYNIFFRPLVPPEKSNVTLYMMILQDVTAIYQKYETEKAFREDTVHMLVHELRNALSTTLLDIKLLRSRLGNSDEIIQKRLKAMELSVRLFGEHMEKLKHYADLMGKKDISGDLKPVNLKDLMKRISEIIDAVYRGRKAEWTNSELVIDIPDNLEIIVDEHLLSIVLKNLVENGLKYSNSRVMVTAEDRGDTVEIRVEDDGEGIPPDKINLIWEAFQRVHTRGSSSKGRIPGLGLGLHIVQRIVSSYMEGASIEVGRSEKLGGASFILKLKKWPFPNRKRHQGKA